MPTALALNRGPGASWHPHRGTTALIRLALASSSADVQYFSWAPVAGLRSTGAFWKVDTVSRGTMTARNIVLATNGWTRHLFSGDSDTPEMAGQ